MKKSILILIMLLGLWIGGIAQQHTPLKFTWEYAHKNDSNDIRLIIENISPNRTYYYSVGLDGLADTGWVHLSSNIDALKDILALKAIKPGQKIFRCVSKKRIFYLYHYYKIRKIRFGVIYYEEKSLESHGEIIYLPSMTE